MSDTEEPDFSPEFTADRLRQEVVIPLTELLADFSTICRRIEQLIAAKKLPPEGVRASIKIGLEGVLDLKGVVITLNSTLAGVEAGIDKKKMAARLRQQKFREKSKSVTGGTETTKRKK